MRTRLSAAPLAALLAGALLAGCGSSSSTTSSQSTAATAPTSSTSPTKTVAGASTPAQAAAACEQALRAVPAISGDVRVKVEGFCSKLASGDVQGASADAAEVCSDIVSSSPLPALQKEQAEAACRKDLDEVIGQLNHSAG